MASEAAETDNNGTDDFERMMAALREDVVPVLAKPAKAPLSPLAKLVYYGLLAPEGKYGGRKNLTESQVELLKEFLRSGEGMPTVATTQVPRAISCAEHLESSMNSLRSILEDEKATREEKSDAARSMATCAKALTMVLGSNLMELTDRVSPPRKVASNEPPKPKNKPPVIVGVQVNVDSNERVSASSSSGRASISDMERFLDDRAATPTITLPGSAKSG